MKMQNNNESVHADTKRSRVSAEVKRVEQDEVLKEEPDAAAAASIVDMPMPYTAGGEPPLIEQSKVGETAGALVATTLKSYAQSEKSIQRSKLSRQASLPPLTVSQHTKKSKKSKKISSKKSSSLQ